MQSLPSPIELRRELRTGVYVPAPFNYPSQGKGWMPMWACDYTGKTSRLHTPQSLATLQPVPLKHNELEMYECVFLP